MQRPTALVALLASGVVVLAGAPASAQETSAAPTRGFGERESGIFALENVLGVSSTTDSQSANGKSQSETYDDKGFFPGFLGPRLSLFGVSDHWTYGAVFSAWWAKPVGANSSDGSSFLALTLGPRIGYAGSLPKQRTIGYWIRTGPTVLYTHGESGGNRGNSSNSGSFDWSIDAYAVVTPVEHFGVFFGPAFDIAIYGQSSGHDDKLGIISFGLGLLADW